MYINNIVFFVPVSFVQTDEEGGSVVVHDVDADVDVGLVPVVHPPYNNVPENKRY